MVPALLFFGEDVWSLRPPKMAPLLARLLRELLAEAMLEAAELECLCTPPSIPLSGRSVASTATLFLLVRSCGNCSRPTRSAISDVSPGLCARIGRAEFLDPVPEELREAVRFTVTTDAEEKELDREEYR